MAWKVLMLWMFCRAFFSWILLHSVELLNFIHGTKTLLHIQCYTFCSCSHPCMLLQMHTIITPFTISGLHLNQAQALTLCCNLSYLQSSSGWKLEVHEVHDEKKQINGNVPEHFNWLLNTELHWYSDRIRKDRSCIYTCCCCCCGEDCL